jgi:death-on-curing protein
VRSFVWLLDAVVLAAHDEQLVEHGGGAGLRDQGLLASALARPRNLAAYGNPDHADCAAAYAFGIARNHPFVDGNKRTAFVALETFLVLNGKALTVDDAEAVSVMLRLAAGELSERELADWIRRHLAPRGGSRPRRS